MASGYAHQLESDVAQAPPESTPAAGAASGLRGQSYAEAQQALTPQPVAPAEINLTDAQIRAAQTYNLESHSISMLSRIRAHFIEHGLLTEADVDTNPRVDVAPQAVADAEFIRAAARYQMREGIASADGMIGPGTFTRLEAEGLEYTRDGGDHPTTVPGANGQQVARTILPANAPDAVVFEYFRAVILEQGGIFLDGAGRVNIVGIRGGQLAGDGSVHQTNNAFNEWNDTLVVLRRDADGNPHVTRYESTTDPGVARRDVATLPEGTHAMAMGVHRNYTALTPAFGQRTPVLRGDVRRLGREGASNGIRGGGLGLNIHTTHGHPHGVLAGPGAYSEGCAVINGQDVWRGFINQMTDATVPAERGGPGQTFIYYTVISAARLDTLVLEDQQELASR